MTEPLLGALAFAFLISLQPKRNGARAFVTALGLFPKIALPLALILAARQSDGLKPFFGPLEILIAFLSAYLLNQGVGKGPKAHFIVTLALTFLLAGGFEQSPWRPFVRALLLVLGVASFHCLILGLRKRLVFAEMPESFKGLPAEFLLVFLLAVAFSWAGRFLTL